jgi:diguanylate cyclase (GGDEF)-like protein
VAFNRVDDVCSVVVDGCAGILGSEISAVYLLDRERWSLCLRATQGRSDDAFVAVVPVSETLLGAAFEDGYAFDSPTDPRSRLSAWLTSPGSVRSQVAVALRAGGESVGVLVLAWTRERRLEEADIERVHIVADQSSLSLQNALLHAELERLSVTDRLTELFNHGYLHQRLDQELQRASRFDRPLSVVMLDIDDFKGYNDRFGHPKGDDVLRDVSALIRENLREMDIAARYGGEEFVVVLPETDAAGAHLVAERIRASVAGHLFAGEDEQHPVHKTVSVGVASFPQHALGIDGLVERADSAMYRAKRAGKDRVEMPNDD